MGKWWILVLLTLCWTAAGLAVFAASGTPSRCEGAQSPRPDRIVSMAPNLTEILFALGLAEKIVAVTNDSDWPPQAASKPRVGTFWQPNIEAVIAKKPQLIVTLAFEQQRNLAERLKRIGYHSIVLKIEKVNDLFDAIGEIGAATGRQDRAKQLTDAIRTKLDNLKSMIGPSRKVKALYVVQREPLRVAGRDTFINEIIEAAGGENAIGATLHKYPPIGAEVVYTCGAEVIIEPTMGQKDPAAQQRAALQYWSKFRNVPAVKNKRIYIIDGDTVSRLGPRLYEGVESIARCLRPGLFTN